MITEYFNLYFKVFEVLEMDLGKCESVRRYKKINRIGEGTYGFVYRAIDRTTKKVVALKRIIMHNEQQDGFPLTSIREIVCLKQCNHPNIVGLYGIAVGDSRDAVFLVFEYCVHDLSSILHNVRNPFKESEIKNLMRQLLLALDYLHNRSIVHRDIKPSNILYSIDGVLKLADFGMARLLARPFQPNLTVNVVTLWYRSPELLLGSPKYSFSMDLWSAGCILGELVLTKPIFPGNDELDQILLVFGILGRKLVSIPISSNNCNVA